MLKFKIHIITINTNLGSSDGILTKGLLRTCGVDLLHSAEEEAEAKKCEGYCPGPLSAKIQTGDQVP